MLSHPRQYRSALVVNAVHKQQLQWLAPNHRNGRRWKDTTRENEFMQQYSYGLNHALSFSKVLN
jgi:hypothetical protein